MDAYALYISHFVYLSAFTIIIDNFLQKKCLHLVKFVPMFFFHFLSSYNILNQSWKLSSFNPLSLDNGIETNAHWPLCSVLPIETDFICAAAANFNETELGDIIVCIQQKYMYYNFMVNKLSSL